MVLQVDFVKTQTAVGGHGSGSYQFSAQRVEADDERAFLSEYRSSAPEVSRKMDDSGFEPPTSTV